MKPTQAEMLIAMRYLDAERFGKFGKLDVNFAKDMGGWVRSFGKHNTV